MSMLLLDVGGASDGGAGPSPSSLAITSSDYLYTTITWTDPSFLPTPGLQYINVYVNGILAGQVAPGIQIFTIYQHGGVGGVYSYGSSFSISLKGEDYNGNFGSTASITATPSAVTNLSTGYNLMLAGDSIFQDSGASTPATSGTEIYTITAPFGVGGSAIQATAANRPIAESFQPGAKFYNAGYSSWSTPIAYSGAFTAYFWGYKNATGTVWTPLAFSGGGKIQIYSDNILYVVDDSGSNYAYYSTVTTTGLIIGRVRRTSGNTFFLSINGAAEVGMTVAGTPGTYKFDTLGGSPFDSLFDTDAADRVAGVLLFNSDISNSSQNVEAYAYINNLYSRQGAQYYVNGSTGNDSNNGLSPSTAFQTLAAITTLGVTAGDTFNISSGTYTSHVTLAPATTGLQPSVGRPVTLRPSGGAVTITPGDNTAIKISNIGNANVSGFTITGPGVTYNGNGTVTFTGLSTTTFGVWASNEIGGQLGGPTINNNVISGFYIGLILGQPTTGASAGYLNPVVSGNTVYDCVLNGITGENGISYSASLNSGGIFSGNYVYNIYGNWTGAAGGNSGYPLALVNYTGATVQGNVCLNSGQATQPSNPAGGPTGIILQATNSCIVSGNIVGGIASANVTVDLGGIDLDGGCVDCIVEYNYIFSCDGAAFEMGDSVGSTSGNHIRFNEIQNCGRTTICGFFDIFSSGATNNFIYNNTVYHDASGATSSLVANTYSGTTNGYYNNVFIVRDSGTFGTYDSTDTFAGNLYDIGSGGTAGTFSITIGGTAYTSLAAMHTAGYEKVSGTNVGYQTSAGLNNIGNAPTSGFGLGSTTSSVTEYDPSNGSTCIGNGLNLESDFSINPGTVDFHGNTLSSPSPIGAVN